MNRWVSVCSQLGDQAFFARDLSDIEMEDTVVDAAFESLRRRRALVCGSSCVHFCVFESPRRRLVLGCWSSCVHLVFIYRSGISRFG